MFSEVIYEKKFPHIDLMQVLEQTSKNNPGIPIQPFSDRLETMLTNSVYIAIPERIKLSETFIRKAIDVSELYQLDTRIERHTDHISVSYSFDCGGGMKYIQDILCMSDQISFFKDIHGCDITMCIDFYTHAAIYKGKQNTP